MGGLYDATKHILKESLLTAVTKLMSSLVPKSPLALKAAENNNNNFWCILYSQVFHEL